MDSMSHLQSTYLGSAPTFAARMGESDEQLPFGGQPCERKYGQHLSSQATSCPLCSTSRHDCSPGRVDGAREGTMGA